MFQLKYYFGNLVTMEVLYPSKLLGLGPVAITITLHILSGNSYFLTFANSFAFFVIFHVV